MSSSKYQAVVTWNLQVFVKREFIFSVSQQVQAHINSRTASPEEKAAFEVINEVWKWPEKGCG